MKELPASIGPYKILKKLGEGGFATVYLAQANDRQDPQRVALKVLNSGAGHKRFQREMKTVANLEHPNIIRVFDTGKDERLGMPYFVMELIPGGNLRDRLETGSFLTRKEAVNLISQIGAALTYAHEQGIVHRDVNPNNILLDTSQEPVRPVLTDFGLVKPLVPDENLTATVGIVGTFNYYAPEQWNKEDVTPATDLYALAITFYEMLTGQTPFKGDIFLLRERHLNEPLPSLSAVAPAVGPFFDDILTKATAKDPEDRYPNVSCFIEAVNAANEEAAHDGEYQEVKRLMDNKEYAQALELLDNEFIRPGNYEYRDVAHLFWSLVYAKQHQGELPPGWQDSVAVQTTEPMPDLESLNRPIDNGAERARIEAQRHKLERQLEVAKYVIPIVLGLAVLAGAITQPQIPDLLKLPVVQIIAIILLTAYLVYYTWIFYISRSRNE